MSSTEQAVRARIEGGAPFTYGELCKLTPNGGDKGRIADRTIQKYRRKGWIAFTREHGSVVWRLTDAGRAEFAQ